MTQATLPATGEPQPDTAARHDDVVVDVAIVGAGPAGLFAAYYAGFRGLQAAVIDSLPEVGGQVTAMYPEKTIFDIAGFPEVSGADLVASLTEQADRFSPRYLLGEQAIDLHDTEDGGVVIGTDRRRVHAQAVVITGGVGTFNPRPLPGGADMVGHGVEYFVTRPNEVAGKDVVVVGGGDSAVDWALMLEPIAKSVALVHRRDTFRAHAHSVQRLHDSTVAIHTDAQIYSVVPDARTGLVSAVEITDKRSERVTRLPAQHVVAALGFIANLGPLRKWGLDMTQRHITVDSRMATNRRRVFAAGDITDYPGKVRLIAVGFGEAATAINNAVTDFDPSAQLFPGHSTG